MFFRKPSDHVPHVTIFHTILRSMLWILFIEIALLVGILYLCRINTNLEQNAVDILQIQTENRQNYLQGQMLDAQDLSSLAGKINAVTQAMLDDGEISLDTLDSGSDAASPLLLSIGDSLISSMRHRPVTGIFVVLNTHDLDTRKKGEPLPCERPNRAWREPILETLSVPAAGGKENKETTITPTRRRNNGSN